MDKLPSRLPFSKKRLSARVIISYIFDYVIIVAFAVGFFILDTVEPYHQHFSLDNKSIQYPYAVHERITIYEALLISLLAPAVIILVYTLLIDGLFSHHKTVQTSTSGRRKVAGPYRFKDRLWELNCGILGLLLSQALAFIITQVLKNAAGKPRPDLISRCQPVPGSQDQPVWGLSNSTICTGDKVILKDGFRSWPSGHSSSSFAGLFYLSLYLSGKLHILDNRGEVWKAILAMIPCLAATLVAVSRIMDARHHPFDVITGSLLGVFTAWASYRQYFPPLSEPWRKGRAYPIRSWGTEPTAPAHVQLRSDDESVMPLRNEDEERLEDRSGPRTNQGISVNPDPQSEIWSAGMYNGRSVDRDGNASSSSEGRQDGFEMTSASRGRRGNAGTYAAAYQPYGADTAYHPHVFTTNHPPVSGERGRPLMGSGSSEAL